MSDVFLDWDISFRDWNRKVRMQRSGKRSLGWMRNRIRLWTQRRPMGVWTVYYRSSSSDRIHIRMHNSWGMTDAGEMLLRTLCHDDAARVYLDIVRWCQGKTTNRLFDTKFKDGRIGHAGPWKLWFRSEPPGKSKPRAPAH